MSSSIPLLHLPPTATKQPPPARYCAATKRKLLNTAARCLLSRSFYSSMATQTSAVIKIPWGLAKIHISQRVGFRWCVTGLGIYVSNTCPGAAAAPAENQCFDENDPTRNKFGNCECSEAAGPWFSQQSAPPPCKQYTNTESGHVHHLSSTPYWLGTSSKHYY